MQTKFLTTLALYFVMSSMFSQVDLNHYKYVIVPKKFDFLKNDNQYQLNALTKFLFVKYGFEALYEGDSYPDDLIQNRCLGLRSDVFMGSGLFKTKLGVELKDCNDKVVYVSALGESRVKAYKEAYNLALRAAFESFETLDYEYVPHSNSQDIVPLIPVNTPHISDKILVPDGQKETKADDLQKTGPQASIEISSEILYAQEIQNGFQLLQSDSKIVFEIKATHLKDVFLVSGRTAIIYKKETIWIIEFYENHILKQKQLDIKF